MKRGLFVKPRLGHWQTVQTQIRCFRMWHLIRVCTVCLNNRKLRFNWNSLNSPFRTIFPAYTPRQSTLLCCQYFDSYFWLGLVFLTLVMLNKLRCHAHFQFPANQITWFRLLILIHTLNDKQCRFRSVGFLEANWPGSTLFAKAGYIRVQQDMG